MVRKLSFAGRSCCLSILIILGLAAPAAAAALIWDGIIGFDLSPDGEFNVADNWHDAGGSVAFPPTIGDTVTFDPNDTYTVTFTQNEASDLLNVVAGDVTFLSDSATLRTYSVTSGLGRAEVSGGNLDIGSAANPVFLDVLDSFNIGFTGVGAVTVDGPDSRLDAQGPSHTVGFAGVQGTLHVTDSATANFAGTLNIGDSPFGGSDGVVDVNTGGTLNTGHIDLAPQNNSSVGTITVNGASISQTLAGATLTVGSASGGTGAILVGNGGTFTSGTGAIAINATGTLSLEGSGDSTFNANGPITMSAGSLVSIDGGALNANAGLDNSSAGTLEFLAGTLTVTGGPFVPNAGDPNSDYAIDGPSAALLPHLVLGAGATANIGRNLFVGDANRGELTVSGGGMVSNAIGYIGFDPNSTGTVAVTDPNSTWTNSSTLFVGDGGNGTLNIQNGGTVSNLFGFIGNDPNSTGMVTVTDPKSTWTNSSILLVGNLGNGTLNITNGGKVSNLSGSIGNVSTSTGMVTVTDPNSTWTNTDLRVGNGGNGTLNITNGGKVSNSFSFSVIIGDDPNSTGMVTVTDPKSTWTNSSDLLVGNLGNGTLNITNGGKVSNSRGAIGFGANSTGMVTVTDPNSTWTNTDLRVGNGGNGTLIIQNGGAVSNTDGFIARIAGTTGTVTVTGADSKWINSGELFVGGSSNAAGGLGSLTVLDKGFVEVAGTLKIWGPGTVTLDGGTLKVDSTAVVVEGKLDYITGTFHLTDAGGYTVGANSGPIDQVLGFANVTIPNGGGLIVDQNLIVPSGTSLTAVTSVVTANRLTNDGLINLNNTILTTTTGLANNADMVLIDTTVEGPVDNAGGSTVTVLGTVDFNGLVSGLGNFFGPATANFNGGMALGASTAEVTVEGSVVFGASNTLFIELAGDGGVAGIDFDQLVVASNVTLGGMLDVSLISPFTLSPGLSFEIIDVDGSLSGTFSGLAEGGLVGNFGGTNLLITYLGGDGNDVTLLSALPGDFDLDGDVDGFDFLAWQRGQSPNPLSQSDLNDWEANYGTVAPLSATATAVPEPASILFAGLALAFACLRRVARA